MEKAGMRPKAIIAAVDLPKSTAYDLLKKVGTGTHHEKTRRKRGENEIHLP
jgi:hypothetical protein